MTHRRLTRRVNYTGQRFGDWQLLERLDQGGFADVYLAKHIYTGNYAAVKVLVDDMNRKSRLQFLREASLLQRLNHPHIVRVFNFSMHGNTPYFAMTYAEKGSLKQRHPSGQVLSMPTVLNYLHQLADALDYMHRRGIIHQDIKPANILVRKDTKLLLCDLGIALTSARTAPQDTHELLGTAAYMAPERFSYLELVSPASDQYSLSILVFEWLTGDVPFHGSPQEIAWQHMNSPAPRLRTLNAGIPLQVERIILKALEKEPQNRFASVQEFVTALTQAWNDTRNQPKPRRRHSQVRSVPLWDIISVFFILDLLTFLSLGVGSYLYNLTPDSAWLILLLTQLVLCVLFSLLAFVQQHL